MSINPILRGISTGLGVLDTLTSAVRKPAAPENPAAINPVDKVRQRKHDQQARLDEAAQSLGVEPQALQQALTTARQQARAAAGNLLDNAAQQIGVDPGALKSALKKSGVKLVDAVA